MKTALITGASSGIGLELAKIHASKKDNLVLIARNSDRLEILKKELEGMYEIQVTNISIDLSDPASPQKIYDIITAKNIQVDYLINNAGFGLYSMFYEADWNKINQLIQVNITSLTHLTSLFLKEMCSRKSGKIMNVSSTAAFQPGPTMAAYYASKAYVLNFSEAINNEVQNLGITVTALCPGPTQSDFQKTAQMEESKMVKNKKLPTSKEVAIYGYNSMMKGKSVAIHGFVNTILANSVRFMPRNLVVKIIRSMQ
jgi:uncharacterized protein